MRFGKRAAAHDGGGDGDLRGLGKLPQFLAGVAGDDAAAAVKHRALRLLDQPDDFVEGEVVGALVGIVAAEVDFGGPDRLGALACCKFLGKSITTGPGRPVRAM